MNLWATTRLALSRIVAAKTRSFLTMLGVVIGVASLVALTSVAAGATSGINNSLSSLGANTVTISGTSSTALTQNDAAAVTKLQHVKAVSYAASGSETAVNGTTTASITVTGESSGYAEIAQPEIAVGSFLPNFPGADSTRSIVLSATAASALGVSAAKIGGTITVAGLPFTLVGVLNDATGFARAGVGYVSFTPARELFAQAPYVSSITVQADNSADVTPVLNTANALLRSRYGLRDTDTAQFTALSQASLLTSLATIQSLLSLLLGGIASISLIVGGIGIMNIMLVSVRERTREIGVRRAIGAKQNQILSQFLIEAIVLSLVGGLLGLVLGIGVSAVIAAIAHWAFTLSSSTIAVALGFSAGVGVVFGVWPARTASRLQPVDALRFE